MVETENNPLTKTFWTSSRDESILEPEILFLLLFTLICSSISVFALWKKKKKKLEKENRKIGKIKGKLNKIKKKKKEEEEKKRKEKKRKKVHLGLIELLWGENDEDLGRGRDWSSWAECCFTELLDILEEELGGELDVVGEVGEFNEREKGENENESDKEFEFGDIGGDDVEEIVFFFLLSKLN